jgi:hypothetical protein
MGIRGLRTVIALGLALLTQLALLSTAGSARSDDELSARWFRVSLPPSPEGGKSRISGEVRSQAPYRVTNVRIEIEGLNADNGPAGRTFAWAVGDLPPGGATFFAVQPIRGSVSYRGGVMPGDLVSFGEAS